MSTGEFRAKTEQLEAKTESEARPGPKGGKGRINMEKFSKSFKQKVERIEQLLPIIESIKLGWFTHLKVKKRKEEDDYGSIINMLEGNENIVLEHLAKEKEKLGAKGDTVGANVIVEQMEALEKYTQLLVERDRLLASAGQYNFLLPKINK